MKATGYQINVPPLVAVGQHVQVSATLVGGADLDADLAIHLAGPGLATDGPIAIPGGSGYGTAILLASGDAGQKKVTATHAGGNSGMADPTSSFTAVGPTNPPATGYEFDVLPAPADAAPWVDHNPTYRIGPDGIGHLIRARLVGGWVLGGPLIVNLSDDAGGTFLGNPVRFGGDVQDAIGAFVYYLPGVAGTRTISATLVRGSPLFATPAPKRIAVPSASSPVTSDRAVVQITPPSPPQFPGGYVLPTITPIYPKATGYTVAAVTPPPGYQGLGVARTGPAGKAQVVSVRLAGGVALDAPLVVTLADDAGGQFPDGPVTLAGDDPANAMALATYIPTSPGLRTITAIHSGGNTGFIDPAPCLPMTFQAT